MPKLASEVELNAKFESTELLYRRVFPRELNSLGELVPVQLESFSFSSTVDGAPSVLRELYANPEDVLHPDCAGKTDVSTCSVFQIVVSQLPDTLTAGDGKVYGFQPVHRPLLTCGAHSVIGSYLKTDTERRYAKPSQAVRNDLRVKMCAVLIPTSFGVRDTPSSSDGSPCTK